MNEIEKLKGQLEKENIYLREKINLQYIHEEIVGRSDVMKDVLSKVEQVARTDSIRFLRFGTNFAFKVDIDVNGSVKPRLTAIQ